MVHFVRITQMDYRDYRRSYSRIEYSFRLKGEPEMIIPDRYKFFMDAAILRKGEFLDELEKEGTEMYFIENESDEIVGITHFNVQRKHAEIIMFAVFEKGKGLGKEAYEILKELFREKGIREIGLECPFDGAREFWKKQGFSLEKNSFCSYQAQLRK